jgi:hypothetical protein
MAALTYNLKKYIRFISKKAISQTMALQVEVKASFTACFSVFLLLFRPIKTLFLDVENSKLKNNLPLERLF